MNFPENPQHNTIFELKPGLIFKYDATVNSWIRIASGDVILQEVSPIVAGVMSVIDLKKLNRLVLPPPESSIIGTDCITPFKAGALKLSSGDDFLEVQGDVDIKNIDEFGVSISQAFPFHIHQHTFGFDFSLDLKNLMDEIELRGHLKIKGKLGPKGETGDKGIDGVNDVLSGNEGDKGSQGIAPVCDLSIEPEPVLSQAREGLKKALVEARVVPDPDDNMRYVIEFDRQNIGDDNSTSSTFNVQQSKSVWVLAVANITGTPQAVYYLDVEPIIEAVHQKFLAEVELLRTGYEDIVSFWIQTMSDLFDEQKDALCCALEFCLSKTKSTSVREHIESVQAQAIGSDGARIRLHEKDSTEALAVSSTNLLPTIGQSDLCDNGQPPPPPPPTPPPPAPPENCTLIKEEFVVVPSLSCLYYAWADPNDFGCGTTGVGQPCETPLGPFKPVKVDVPDGARFLQQTATNNDFWGDGIGVYTANGGSFKGPLKNLCYVDDRYGSGAIVGLTNSPYGSLVGMFQVSPFNPPPLNSLREIQFGTFTQHAVAGHTLWLGLHDGITETAAWCDNSGGNNQITARLLWYDRPCSDSTSVLDASKVQSLEDQEFVIDPLLHSGNVANGVKLDLPEGKYVAIIQNTESKINGHYYAPLRVQHAKNGERKVSQFLIKGKFKTQEDAQLAYSGLTMPFDHEGGQVSLFFGVISGVGDHGITTVKLQLQQRPDTMVQIQSDKSFESRTCRLLADKLRWYEERWQSGECCGMVVEVAGQEYIVIKVSVGEDDSCGGGENISNPCLMKFEDTYGHPAIAWPTLDGKSFAPIPDGSVIFRYNQDVNNIILEAIETKKYESANVGHRKLEYAITSILVPVA